MTLIEFFLLLLVAAICGGIAQSLAGYSRGGCLTSIALGFIGALPGSFLADRLQLPEPLNLQIGERAFPILWSIIGAALFTAVPGLMNRRGG